MTSPTGGRHDTPTAADALSPPSTAPSQTPLNTSCQTFFSLFVEEFNRIQREGLEAWAAELFQDGMGLCPQTLHVCKDGTADIAWDEYFRGLHERFCPRCGLLAHPITARAIGLWLVCACAP